MVEQDLEDLGPVERRREHQRRLPELCFGRVEVGSEPHQRQNRPFRPHLLFGSDHPRHRWNPGHLRVGTRALRY